MQNNNAHNLVYAIVQIVHNFGAVTLLGAYIAAWVAANPEGKKKAAAVALAGWAAQVISGISFGVVSFIFYRKFPDIGVIGKISLLIKIFCAGAGLTLMCLYIYKGTILSEKLKNLTWISTAGLAVIALCAAAFLRWFS